MSPDEIKEMLSLVANPKEGGFLAGVYNSAIRIPANVLPGFPTVSPDRLLCGAIYYFLDSTTRSLMHRVTGDMLYHFYGGGPVQMLLLYPQGSAQTAEVCIFGGDLAAGQRPVKVIPGGTWLGSRLLGAGQWALMGVSMAPGFDPADYAIAARSVLLKQFPAQADLICALTQEDG